MDRVTKDALRAGAAGWLEHTNNNVKKEELRREVEEKRLASAKARAERLAAQLAPLFPIISAATKSVGGLETWVDSWARQIVSANLRDPELLQGLQGIAAAVAQAGNPPLSFSLFLSACRPDSHLTGSDVEARQRHPLLLTRDRLQDADWCSARDRALAKLRAMGCCKSRPE